MSTSEIKISLIDDDANFNCRGAFTEFDIIGLANSIKANGLLQNLVVSPKDNGRYTLVAGFRRLAALRYLKKETATCQVKHLDNEEAAILNLEENVARKELNILQEAKGVENLRALGLRYSDIAERLKKTTSWVQLRISVLKLCPELQERVLNKDPDLTQDIIIAAANRLLHDDQLNFVKNTIKAKKQTSSRRLSRGFSRSEIKKPENIAYLALHFEETYGPNPTSYALRWSIGLLSDSEFERNVKNYYNQLGETFYLPSQLKK